MILVDQGSGHTYDLYNYIIIDVMCGSVNGDAKASHRHPLKEP